MRGLLVIQELERWFLRRRSASTAPKANLALVADDPGALKQFGAKITEYLNLVDDPENGGWFLFDDALLALLTSRRRSEPFDREEVTDGEDCDGWVEHLFLNGGAVIVCTTMRRSLDGEREDVRVLLTGFENREDEPPRALEDRGVVDLDGYHAAVNAGRLPGAMVVCLVGDTVLELSYRRGVSGLQ